ncbi:MAG: transmembrane 220 family protein [Bacteroidota bacterium]
MMMKIVNIVLAVMFLVFAFLQLNDPDPVVWILVYGAMAAVCIMAAFRYYSKKFLLSLLVLYVAYSIVFLPGVQEWMRQENKGVLFDDVMKMEHPYIEESREFLGLMICVAVLVVQLVRSRRS